MATPLYKRMKQRGTSFYAFPSAAEDMNLAFSNEHYKLNFTKFILLNIPEQKNVLIQGGGGTKDQNDGKLNFDKNDEGPLFYNFQPGGNGDLSLIYSEQLIESLRNYVANYDSTLRESRINENTDFYNINERVTPSEMIFWKWCKKLNLLDLEPAIHKIDWNKNMTDFDNRNGTSYDYFQKYLWKERDVNYYSCTIVQNSEDGILLHPKVTTNTTAKFKSGDIVMLSGTTGVLSANTSYHVYKVEHDTNSTHLHIDKVFNGSSWDNVAITNATITTTVYLNYQRFVEYIGEVQAVSKIQTSKRNFTEVTAHVPHHAGKTPTILYQIETNTNYYPGLEMPLLPQEQQEEIVGSENTNSPIRLRPQDYPGSYYGYFDTIDKTYKCNTGDKMRYKGDYYGVLLSNNVGVDFDNYVEKLNDFNSDNIDGLKIDMDRDHYLKMNLPGNTLRNFDEFNSADFDGAPEDFDFNAILWYYELDDGSGTIVNNLYGIEFLNNPSDDSDVCDTDNNKISVYKKYVSNGNQDGVSYIFNLNVNFNIDNDVLPATYDPTTTYNQFGFDLYQNIMNSNAKLQENFMTIISAFTYIQDDLFDIRSLIYSQTDINTIKSQISNLNDLLELYSTFQFVDSNTTTIETDYTGVYPTLKVNATNPKYAEIVNVNTSDILYYNNVNSGLSYVVPIPLANELLINVYNDNNIFYTDSKILLNTDLSYKQSVDIYIKPNLSTIQQKLNVNINYNNGVGVVTETSLLSGVTLPIDLTYYDSIIPTASTYANSYYTNTNVKTYVNEILTGVTSTKLYMTEDLFKVDDYVYIDNFYLIDSTNNNVVKDYSGVYRVSAVTWNPSYWSNCEVLIDLPSYGLNVKTKSIVSYYKGWKVNILRVSSSPTSSISDRYQITKELL